MKEKDIDYCVQVDMADALRLADRDNDVDLLLRGVHFIAKKYADSDNIGDLLLLTALLHGLRDAVNRRRQDVLERLTGAKIEKGEIQGAATSGSIAAVLRNEN